MKSSAITLMFIFSVSDKAQDLAMEESVNVTASANRASATSGLTLMHKIERWRLVGLLGVYQIFEGTLGSGWFGNMLDKVQ
jgi:hypothetical protein